MNKKIFPEAIGIYKIKGLVSYIHALYAISQNFEEINMQFCDNWCLNLKMTFFKTKDFAIPVQLTFDFWKKTIILWEEKDTIPP